MGRNRYYCEYCERSFLDDLRARKKHLTGTQHVRSRKMYYHPYRSAKEIYEEEKGKDPCRKFLTTNFCPYGDYCRFSHCHPPELERLRINAEQDSNGTVSPQALNDALDKMPSSEKISEWLTLWQAKHKEEALKPTKPVVQAVSKAWSTDMPIELRDRRDLPPSLQPWSKFNLQDIHIEDWG